MSNQIDVVRVDRTGALIRLHEGNQALLANPGNRRSKATVDEKTGRLTEVDGADNVALIAASSNLVRIGDALVNNKAQRETLLTSALKLPGSAAYLENIGVYQGKDDNQFIDPDTLHANNAGLPESPVQVGIKDVTAELNAEKPKKRAAKKKSDDETTSGAASLDDL